MEAVLETGLEGGDPEDASTAEKKAIDLTNALSQESPVKVGVCIFCKIYQ